MIGKLAAAVLLFLCLISSIAEGRPEYAVRYNILSCRACHFSPVGGGPRNINGKLFGAHGYKINPVLVQDYVDADLRALYYYPQRPGGSKDGSGIMSGSIAGHAAIDEDKKIEVTIEHNVAGFSAAGYRDTYFLFNLADDDSPGWLDTLMVGRFRLPYGIISDEHRTYVRIQNETRWFDYETGLLLSGQPSRTLHYDIGFLNGEKNTGSNLVSGEAERFGGVLNLRWMPGPYVLGVSGTYHDRSVHRDSPYSGSLYGIVSVGRWTDDRVPLDVHLEVEQAASWDSALGQGFAKDQSYVGGLARSVSRGFLAYLEYHVNQRFHLIYKYDLLMPDRDYPSDVFDRHGIGFRWTIGPNLHVQWRSEFARATHPSEQKSYMEAAQNASYAILQLEL